MDITFLNRQLAVTPTEEGAWIKAHALCLVCKQPLSIHDGTIFETPKFDGQVISAQAHRHVVALIVEPCLVCAIQAINKERDNTTAPCATGGGRMRIEVWEQRLPGYVVRQCGEVFVGEQENNGIEMEERAIREYAGHCAVYLEAFAAFERAMEEARAAAQPPDALAPEVE